MKKYIDHIQLYLRLAMGAGFLYAGLDRFGAWGPPGGTYVAWGNWENFMQYTSQLLFFLPAPLITVSAIIASVGEVGFGLLLVLGLCTRISAIGSGILTALFALSMSVALGVNAPLGYSVFTFSAAGFLLATLPQYKWSIDNWWKQKKRQYEAAAALAS